MASNELAAILARRRAKDGSGAGAGLNGDRNSPPAAALSSSNENSAAAVSSVPSATAADPVVKRSSIAERIARLQQQSANAAPAAAVPVPIAIHRNSDSNLSESQPQPASASNGGWSATTSSSSASASASSFGATSWSSSTVNEPTASPSASAVAAPLTGEPSSSTTPVAGSSEWKRPSRTSDRIAQLQGNLGGFGMNPFRPGAAPPIRRTGGGESIMTTGDQYAAAHGMPMGVAMPGMGAAVPMPGLAKAGTRIPGMMQDSSDQKEEPAPSPDVEHATMSRAAAPKRRAPTRMPPGAVRIPGAGPPVVASPSAQSPLPVPSASPVEATVQPEVAAVETPSPISHSSGFIATAYYSQAPVVQAAAVSAPVESPVSAAPAVPAPVAVAKPPYQAPAAPSVYQPPSVQPSFEPAPVKRYTSPADELFAAFTPEELGMGSAAPSPAPVVTSAVPQQPVQSSSTLFGSESTTTTTSRSSSSWNSSSTTTVNNQPLSAAVLGSVKEPEAVLQPKPESPKPFAASSLFGATPESSVSVAGLSISNQPVTETTKPEPLPATSVFREASGTPVQFTSSWNSAPTASTPASTASPAAAPAPAAPVAAVSNPAVSAAPRAVAAGRMTSGVSLFGAATAADDDSSDSDWSDNEDNKSPKRPSTTGSFSASSMPPNAANKSVIGGATPSPIVASGSAAAPAPGSGSAGALFGDSSTASTRFPTSQSTSTPTPAPSSVGASSANAIRQPGTTLVPPPRMGTYSNLFGAGDSEESSSDSEDESGLFGTGLPSKR